MDKKLCAFTLLWLSGTFAGMNTHLFALMQRDFVSDSFGSSYILSGFLFGWMFGGILLGFLSDRFGRVKSLVFSILLYSLSMGLCGFSDSVWHFVLCRFLTGMGVGGTMVSISVYISEIWAKTSRAVAIGAVITSYQAGILLSGIVAEGFSNWREAFFVCASPSIIAGFAYFILEEPKEKRRTIYRWDNQYKMSMFVGAGSFGALLIGYWASMVWIPVWIQELGATVFQRNLATIIHGSIAVLGCLVCGFLVDRFGRIRVISASLIGAFTVSLWMFLGNREFNSLIYIESGLLGFFLGTAQAGMYIYLPELFPKEIRATGVGFCLNGGRCVTALLVMLVGFMVQFFGGYSETLIAFSSMYLVAASILLVSPKIVTVEAGRNEVGTSCSSQLFKRFTL